MINQIPKLDIPQWLSKLVAASVMNEPFPLRELLKDSFYYPSSGFDGRPIQQIACNFLSFIYVDYGYSRDEFMVELNKGFLGYDLLAERAVTAKELTPNGWRPTLPRHEDGNPDQYFDLSTITKQPFCSWSVFQRREDFPASHGPARFSLLYLCADGVAAFQALYVAYSPANLRRKCRDIYFDNENLSFRYESAMFEYWKANAQLTHRI